MKNKIKQKIKEKEKELRRLKKRRKEKSNEEELNYHLAMREDRKFKNTINPFYKNKTIKLLFSHPFSGVGSAIYEGFLIKEIKELKELLK